MATCKDCFHFDVCRAMLEATCGIRIDDDFKGGAGSCKKFVNSADVAPRAEWISVDERLPSSEDLERSQFHNFLVANEFGEVREAVFTGKYFAKLGSRLSGITHWMPLPEPPNMKGDAE